MYSIGMLAKASGVKVTTIRYYEQCGLLKPPLRTLGNQRRYDASALQRLHFICHAREFGFSLEAISALILLSEQPQSHCSQAAGIAREQLALVRRQLKKLQALEAELVRISEGCSGNGTTGNCYILNSLSQ